MTTKLSSLRVTAEMDVSQYVRAAAQKVSADGDMVGSAKAVGRALAATDAAASKAVPGVASLSRVWITGYGDAAKFESAVRSIGKALDRGMDPARAAAALDGVYRKFGQTADAASMARQGFVALAPVVAALNDRYEVNAAVADRAAAATKRLADAQATQQRINASFGIGSSAGSARDSADAFLGSVGGLEGVAAARGRAVADSFTTSLNEALIAGAPRSARQSASAFTAYFDEIAVEIKRREAAVTASVARMQAVQERLQQVHRIGYQFDSTQGARASMSAFIEEDERAVRSLTQAYNPLLTNEERRNEALKTAQGLLARRSIDEKQYATVVTNINKVHDDTKKALEGAFTATGKWTSGVGLARHELINLGRQAQDVFVSLASGQSPMTVLIQQGTQIADVFAASRGSVMGFLGQMGPALLRLAGPIAAVTTALGAMYAAFKVSSEQQTLSNSLLGAGRTSGLAGGQLEGLARESAQAADITVSNARLIGAEYVKLGRIANDNLPKLTRITKDYAAVNGQDLKSAAQEIAQALADPARGAQGLSDKIGGLDSTTLRMIRTATDFNDKLRAQRLLMEELGRATDNAADQSLSKWDRLTKEMGIVFGRLKEGAAGAVLGPDRSEEIATARSRIREIEQQLATGRTTFGQESGLRAEVGTLRQKLSALEAIEQKEREAARVKAEASASSRKTNEGEAVALATGNQGLAQQLRLYNETIGRVNTLDKSLEELRAKRNAIGVPDDSNRERFATLTQQIKEQTEALEGQQKVARDLQGITSGLSLEQERARRNTELDLKASQDKTLADAQATAAERARINMLGEAVSTSREAAAIKLAERATARGTVALNEQSKVIQDGITVTNAQTEAYRRGGVAAAEVARIRKEAAQQARTTGGDAEVIFRERLNKEIAETKRGLAEKIALQRQEASATNAANAAASAGNLSAKQRADLEERLQAEREAYNKLIATGLVTEKEAARLAKEQADSVSRVQDARTEAAALGMLADQRESTELLRLEVSLLGKSVEERSRVLAVLKAEQALRRQGIDPASDLGRQYLDGAKVEAALNATKERFVDFGKDLTSILGGAFDDLFTQTDKGFEGVVDNALKSFAKLGTRLIENQILKPLMSGQGLGSLFGTTSAANDNGTLNVKPLTDSLERGASGGIIDGFKKIGSWLFGGGSSAQGQTQSASAPGSAGGGLSFGGVAGLGVAALAGYGMGQQSQSPLIGGLGGALSGAVAGSMILPGIGTAIGAVVGGLSGAAGGIMGQSAAKKQRRQEMMAALKQYQDDWAQIQPEVERQRALWRGETEGGLTGSFREARTNFQSAAKTAQLAGDKTAVFAMERDLQAFLDRSVTEFRRSFAGTLDALNQGFGLNSPFLQASKSVKDTGEALKGFVADTQLTDGAYEAAREASRTYAMSLLTGAREIGAVEAEIQRINGTASSLSQVLVDLGMSADAAAEAVEQGVVVAMDRLRAGFERDLDRKTLSALDRDHINETADLFAEVERLRADAALLGTDQARVSAYFQAAAQKIVNGADLTGAAFDDLIARFPALAGLVVEAGQAIGEAAREIEAAKRRLGYQDRLFAALNDSTTLDGQLAAFDRSAHRQRLEEMRAGGQAINDLEAALAAERLKIIETFADQAAAEQKRAKQEAQNFFDGFTRNLRQFVDNMRAGNDSPLSPEARLAAAQSQYNAQLALAQGGNRDAINGLTGYASSLLDAAKGFYASSPAFQAIFEQVAAQLTALPTQVSAEQFIVDAIEHANTSLLASLARLDTNGDGMISLQEAANSNLAAIFSELDTNGDGQISRLELIRAAAQGTDANTEIANTLLQQVQALGGATNSLMESSNSMQQSAVNFASTQNGLLGELISLNTTSLAMLNALNRQFSLDTDLTIRGVGVNNNMVTALNKIAYNTAFIMQYTGNAGGFGTGNIGAFASGGWISGPGSPTSDSVPIWASNGEFMVNAAAASRHASLLEAINGGASFADLATFSRPRPAPGPVFVPPANQNDGSREIVAELRRLHARIEQLEQRLIEAEYGSAGVVAGEVAGVRQEQRRAAADARQDRNRPDRAGKRVA
ncbi:hypothetical protein DK26_15045 [Bosea sp. WAO]|uniref:phage tail length tape measure family protein n=1 Tax=Bosea sp. WAO TaxID=406341 RepID=UPI00074AE013|nr:phage tail length tape measure family protein [Bosea sp. WAO]KUL94327.1 hypothetical protein DK26_15045 [Bosea sp. WAO]